jgi:hypothetical protein
MNTRQDQSPSFGSFITGQYLPNVKCFKRSWRIIVADLSPQRPRHRRAATTRPTTLRIPMKSPGHSEMMSPSIPT